MILAIPANRPAARNLPVCKVLAAAAMLACCPLAVRGETLANATAQAGASPNGGAQPAFGQPGRPPAGSPNPSPNPSPAPPGSAPQAATPPALVSPPASGGSGPIRVTTDTPEYCEILSQRVVHAERAPSATPAARGKRAEVEELVAEGHQMCATGLIRGGLVRLRRAWMLLTTGD